MRPSAPGTGNVPYLDVRRSLEARVATSVFYELAELAEAEGEDLGVWSRGRFFTLEAGGAGLDAG